MYLCVCTCAYMKYQLCCLAGACGHGKLHDAGECNVAVYVCMYMCIHEGRELDLLCIYACMYVHVYTCRSRMRDTDVMRMYICVYMCVYVCICVGMYVCTNAA